MSRTHSVAKNRILSGILNSEKIVIFDGTFQGLLSAIFDCYDLKISPIEILGESEFQEQLFAENHQAVLDESKAKRVAKKLREIAGSSFLHQLHKVFLSEKEGRGILVYRLVSKVLKNGKEVLSDFRDDDVLQLKKIQKEINREVHRMHAFVRFQRLADDIWFAAIEPDFDVVPLIGEHFEKRYADQKWVIFDVKRKYGLSYDLDKVDFIEMELPKNAEKLSKNVLHSDEISYQNLWKDYFDSVNIKARKNMKLHIRHVPKRYWKYLFEK